MNTGRLKTDQLAFLEAARSGRIADLRAVQLWQATPLPYVYEFSLACPGLEKVHDPAPRASAAQDLTLRYQHRVRVQFQQDHPRRGPVVTVLQPLFHPNIHEDGRVCYGEWTAAWDVIGLLDQLRDLFCYERYSRHDRPRERDHFLNGAAFDWAAHNTALFPLRRRIIRVA